MHDDALRLENQICFRLYKTSRTMIRVYQPKVTVSVNIAAVTISDWNL